MFSNYKFMSGERILFFLFSSPNHFVCHDDDCRCWCCVHPSTLLDAKWWCRHMLRIVAVVVATVSISSARRWWHVVAKGNFNGSWSVANRQILHVEPRVHIVEYQHEAWVLNHFHFICTNTKQQLLLDFTISTCCYYPSNRMRRMHPLLHDTVSPLLLMRAVKKKRRKQHEVVKRRWCV